MTLQSRERIARYWNSSNVQPSARVNWWSSAKCVAYQNAVTCGKELPGISAGCRERLASASQTLLKRGISIGCGSGGKEQELVSGGLVERMELWELSTERIRVGRERVEAAGLADRITFHCGDAFSDAEHQKYDLVYWDHSLHHMMDVRSALQWSVDRLRSGGFLLVNDYCGPNRLQWTDREIVEARRALADMRAAEAFAGRDPVAGNWLRKLRMKWKDPSEASESEAIPDAMTKICGKETEINFLGGTLLNILGPLTIPALSESSPAIEILIGHDRDCREKGFSHFFFSLWKKP